MTLGTRTQWLLLIVTLIVAVNFFLDQARRTRIETLEFNEAQMFAQQQMNGLFQVECVDVINKMMIGMNNLAQQIEATRCKCNEWSADDFSTESPPGVEPEPPFDDPVSTDLEN